MYTGTGSEPAIAPRPYEDLERIFVAGRWRDGRARKHRADRSPWTGEVLLESSLADASDVDEAYQAAATAGRRWWHRLPQERAAVLSRAVALMDERKEEITGWIRRESGGTRAKAELEW